MAKIPKRREDLNPKFVVDIFSMNWRAKLRLAMDLIYSVKQTSGVQWGVSYLGDFDTVDQILKSIIDS